MHKPSSQPQEHWSHSGTMSRRLFVGGSLASLAMLFTAPEAVLLAGEESERLKRFQQSAQRAKPMRDDPNWLLKKHPDLLGQADAFVVECVDEGEDAIAFYLEQVKAKKVALFKGTLDVISVPGSGKTYPKVSEDIKDQRLKVVCTTSHCSCGACGGKDDIAIEAAKKTADDLGVPYAGHVDTLDRPMGMHVATGSGFRYTPKVKGLNGRKGAPIDFENSMFAIRDRDARVQTAALNFQIALGEHGFGKLFLEHGVPYHLWALFDPKAAMTEKKIRDELAEAIDKAKVDDGLRKEMKKKNLFKTDVIGIS